MYKEMIPADLLAPRRARQFSSGSSHECPTILTAIPATNEEASVPNELAEWKGRYLRLAAEFDNFKKRTGRESERRAAEQKFACVPELLPVVDNSERALAGRPVRTVEQLREGVESTPR